MSRHAIFGINQVDTRTAAAPRGRLHGLGVNIVAPLFPYVRYL